MRSRWRRIVLTDKPDERIGLLRIQFSRDKLDATIRSNFYQLILQILAVDLVLIVLLLTSLRIVFRPLADLREALDAGWTERRDRQRHHRVAGGPASGACRPDPRL